MSHPGDFAIVELCADSMKMVRRWAMTMEEASIAMAPGLFYLPIPESLIVSGVPDLAGSLGLISI
jgi:hypothetical protein